MDLYGSGTSISQANNLSREARSLAHQARDFNGQLAANIDEVRNQKDQEGLEQQVINMYKGVQSTSSFAKTKQGADFGKLVKGGVARGGTLLPVSFTEKFSRGPARVAREFDDVAVGSNTRSALRAGAREVGGSGVDAAFTNNPVSSSGFLGGASEAADVEDIPGGLLSGPAAQGGRVGEQAIVEGSSQAERTGQFAEYAGRSGARVIGTSAEVVAKGAAKEAVEAGARSAATKVGLAGLGGGLDIYKDVARGGIGNNWKQEVGNVGNIIGSGLEIAGAVGAFAGVGVPLEALGAVLSIGSTALETAGDYQDNLKTKGEETDALTAQTQGIGGAQKVTTAIARTQ